jgi:hypothetical protein
MANGIYTFSTAKKEDRKFIDDLTIKARQQGVSFSWLVIQALREYSAKREESKNERT